MSAVDPSKDLLTSSSDKQNALDAIPTSSTDANVTFAKTESAIEDPISSTSSEVCPAKYNLEEETDNFDISSAVMGQSKSTEQAKPSTIETEEEFLNLSMENVSGERITEDVEDIVHDLENLLGDTYNNSSDRGSGSKEKNSAEDIALTLELEKVTEKKKESTDTTHATETAAVEKEENFPNVPALAAVVPPSEQLDETTKTTSEEPESDDLPRELEPNVCTNEESELVPIVTEPEETPPQEIPTTCDVEEIHSTIQEELEVPSSPRKTQRVKLVRSPINVTVEQPQIQEIIEAESEVSQEESLEIHQEENAKETEITSVVDNIQNDAVVVETDNDNVMEVEEFEQPQETATEAVKLLENEATEMEVEDGVTETFSTEPMVVEDDAKEIVIKDVAVDNVVYDDEEPIPIDDPVAAVEDPTPEFEDVPVELEEPVAVLNDLDIVPADNDQLITESSVIDELIETADLGGAETDIIPTVDPEPMLDSVNLDGEAGKELLETAPVVDEVMSEIVQNEEPASEDIPAVLKLQEIAVEESLEAEVEKCAVLKQEEAVSAIVEDLQETNTEKVSDIVAEKAISGELDLEINNLKQVENEEINEEITSISKTEVQKESEKVVPVQDSGAAELVEMTESNSENEKLVEEIPKSTEIVEHTRVVAQEINPNLKTTLTVDVSEQETTTMYGHDDVGRLSSPKTAVKHDSQNLLKITISKQADNTHSILKVYNPDENTQPAETSEKVPKLLLKSLLSPQDPSKKSSKLMSPTSVPKVTIKPIVKPESPVKLTIKPIVKPDEIHEQQQRSSPKLIIKPIVKPDDYEQQRSSPKLTIKPIVKPDEMYEPQKSSPKLTIKPIAKPDDDFPQEQQTKTFEVAIQEQDEQQGQARSSPKITIKSVVKHDEDAQKQKFSPKLTIKPIPKPEEVIDVEHYQQKSSPKLTIKPIPKPEETVAQEEQKHPKLTIKPIVRPDEQMHSPKITIKPVVKPQDDDDDDDVIMTSVEEYAFSEQRSHARGGAKTDGPKVTIKPVVKPAETTTSQTGDYIENEEEIKQERIILKINKNTLPPSRKREHADDGGEKLAKIKVKYSKEGGHAHIVPQSIDSMVKHPQPETEAELRKRFKLEDINIPQGVTIMNIEPGHSRQKDLSSTCQESVIDEVNIEPIERVDTSVFPVSQPVVDLDSKDPLGDIPSFENVAELAAAAAAAGSPSPLTPTVVSVPSPRRRGRPRKVPLEVREEFKDPPKEEEEPPPQPVVVESTRPKRSCRGPSVRTTLGIKPRKPRGPGRGRGGKRGVETRATVMKPGKEPRVSIPKLKLLKETITSSFLDESVDNDVEHVKDIDIKPDIIDSAAESRDVPIYEEETRMSADAGSSRAQTPAKQVPTPIADVVVEESQSSVQSTATTESAKGRRGPRLEVHQEPEGAIIAADQLAEYSWGGGGPYMLQEQVAQFLGIKSFKRKYPGIQRRPVEMQERDFIRESGLASEAMCDLGLTAVNSADILDIMYSDFQPKYEEYCKHQRDRQAKDLTNKQKALTLAVSQEKNNLTEQAVQSAAAWNSSFNKARREKRKACMDLQTFTIHYPKGKMKQINRPPVGNYPVALVPGQFTDYYKEFTPAELSNLPLNTVCYNTVNMARHEDDSQSDGSVSDSDSSSSDSDSSDSGSSEGENCTVCSSRPSQKQLTATH